MPLFNLFGHVTDVSNVNVPPGVTEDGDTETVQSLYTLLGAIVVVVGATVVVVVGATVVVVVGATVSKAIDSVELAVLPLPAESAKTPAPTEI